MPSFADQTKTSFDIIAKVGEARSLYLEAIAAARSGGFRRAQQLIERAEASFRAGHAAHSGLVQLEAAGDPTSMSLMLTHAEDQLMSAEGFGILASEFLALYRLLADAGVIVPAAEATA